MTEEMKSGSGEGTIAEVEAKIACNEEEITGLREDLARREEARQKLSMRYGHQADPHPLDRALKGRLAHLEQEQVRLALRKAELA